MKTVTIKAPVSPLAGLTTSTGGSSAVGGTCSEVL
jgi:hypothetical protein